MQPRPTAAELLSTIADLLDDELLPALPAHLQHKARVAANLARILERESTSAPAAAERERAAIAGLLGLGGATEADLAERLRAADDPALERAAWDVLVAVARDDLAIAKPGHDAWEGG